MRGVVPAAVQRIRVLTQMACKDPRQALCNLSSDDISVRHQPPARSLGSCNGRRYFGLSLVSIVCNQLDIVVMVCRVFGGDTSTGGLYMNGQNELVCRVCSLCVRHVALQSEQRLLDLVRLKLAFVDFIISLQDEWQQRGQPA